MSGQTFPYQTVRDVDVQNKQILVREGYDVPFNDDGTIADDLRIIVSLPTLKYLIKLGAKIVLIAHAGRPEGAPNPKLSFAPVAKDLSDKLAEIYKELNQPTQEVKFVDDCIGEKVRKATENMKPGEVILLENLRFHPEEEKNDADFAKTLADDSHAEIFVQDAFSNLHRAHASMDAITHYLPSVAGLLVEKEYIEIKSAIEDPNRPLTAIMGGAKISDKIPLVKKFVGIADNVVIGGAMANNFLKEKGINVASSLVEKDQDGTIREILDAAHKKFGADFDKKFILPSDAAIAPHGDPTEERVEIDLSDNPLYGEAKIFDLGTKTIDQICETIRGSGTVIWNGDLGIDSTPQFSHASSRVALELAKNPHVVSIIGGGDTADFVRGWDSLKGGSFTHVSTGGGASLELMAGDTLPGIAALLPRR
ncbi:phosphoglycerate kinase [Candidatus Saccharibacteria bacterium]|nr:phosphoglycerate kinase [Candidatus Saccharibacteria bacterium]